MVDRKLAGAHYGLRDWAAQRITAIIMIIYAVVFFLFLLGMAGAEDYSQWQAFFGKTWVKVCFCMRGSVSAICGWTMSSLSACV